MRRKSVFEPHTITPDQINVGDTIRVDFPISKAGTLQSYTGVVARRDDYHNGTTSWVDADGIVLLTRKNGTTYGRKVTLLQIPVIDTSRVLFHVE